MYGVAISASLAVLVVMVAAMTLLPAILSYLGRRVDRLRIPLLGRALKRGGRGIAGGSLEPCGAATALGRAIGSIALLLALASPALGMRLGFPDAGNDPPSTMTRQAYDLITRASGRAPTARLCSPRNCPNGPRAARQRARRTLRHEPGIAYVAAPTVNRYGSAALLITVTPTTSPQD